VKVEEPEVSAIRAERVKVARAVVVEQVEDAERLSDAARNAITQTYPLGIAGREGLPDQG
jgi:hypothetical protein